MKENNLVRTKSFDFAVRIVILCNHLVREKREYVLSRQLLKSGTSIGANIEEAIGAQSRKDFLHKLSIAYKEARESLYWLRLLTAVDFIDKNQSADLIKETEELCRLIGRIQISTKAMMS